MIFSDKQPIYLSITMLKMKAKFPYTCLISLRTEPAHPQETSPIRFDSNLCTNSCDHNDLKFFLVWLSF